jgi:hypothetical protein
VIDEGYIYIHIYMRVWVCVSLSHSITLIIQNFQEICAMEILKNGFSSFEGKKAKPVEGGRSDSQVVDIGKLLALLLLFTLPIVIVALARKEPWCSTREGLQEDEKPSGK